MFCQSLPKSRRKPAAWLKFAAVTTYWLSDAAKREVLMFCIHSARGSSVIMAIAAEMLGNTPRQKWDILNTLLEIKPSSCFWFPKQRSSIIAVSSQHSMFPSFPKPNPSKVLKLGSPKYLENCGPRQLPPGLGQLQTQAMVNVLHNPGCNGENRVWVIITPQLCHI